jgi:O-antigen/teichoic acid export membrane protein
VLAARFLSVHEFGTFGNLVAIVGILSKLIDFGLGPIVFREASKDADADSLLNSALSIRTVLFLIVLTGFNIAMFFLKFSQTEFVLANVLFTSIILSTRMQNFRELLATPFKVHLKMHYPMTLTILDNLLFLVGVVSMPIVNGGLYYFVMVYVFSTVPGFIIQFVFLERKFQFRPKFNFYKASWLIKESAPLAGFVLLTIIYQQLDVVLLTSFKDEYSAGIYSVATRLPMPLSIIPGIIVTTVFPFLVKNLEHKTKTDLINSLVYKVLFLISFVLAVVFTFKSEQIVSLVFGNKYSAAGLPTSLIFWSLVFMFFNYFTLDLLTAHNRQLMNFIYSVILVVSNTILNVLLIPSFSYNGVGFSKVFAGFLGFTFMAFALKKEEFSLAFINFRFIMFLFMVLGAAYLLSLMPLIPYLLLFGFALSVLLITTGYFNSDEWDVILRLINREKWGRFIHK